MNVRDRVGKGVQTTKKKKVNMAACAGHKGILLIQNRKEKDPDSLGGAIKKKPTPLGQKKH